MLAEDSMFPIRSEKNVMRAKAMVFALGALAASACVPDWARQGDSPEILLMTGINNGAPLDSDVRISSGTVCPDFVSLRVENHQKNPLNTDASFRADIVIERYGVRYFRSDGRNTEGVDVPYAISGNVAQEVQAGSSATLSLEVVRRQAKLEPPLKNLIDFGGGQVVTMFAEVTIHARSTVNQTTNAATARLQIDFADFADTLTACPAAQ
ncbi:MAG: hypothetical protein DMF77_23975 [Acidobacteria bacterium]|nr:MAG: hypothetical protein DMF77_23975 [Acidobacteriota bacterium]